MASLFTRTMRIGGIFPCRGAVQGQRLLPDRMSEIGYPIPPTACGRRRRMRVVVVSCYKSPSPSRMTHLKQPRALRRICHAGALAVLWLAWTNHASAWRSELYPADWQAPDATLTFYTDKLIQDFSYAGYRRGEEPIPQVEGPVFDVTAYGADPSGATDSTAAIQAAIDAAAATGGGVVFLPPGEFRVAPQGNNRFSLSISSSNIVLRGAGVEQTFLLNTSHLMRGKNVIQIAPPSTQTGVAVNITADLPGPTHRIPVANPNAFTVGDMVRVEWAFTEEWIAEHNQQTWWSTSSRPVDARYFREVVSINAGEGWIELDVPTRYSKKVRDRARVSRVSGFLTGVGVESFSIGNLQHPGSGWAENDYTDGTKAAYDVHDCYLVRVTNVRDSWISDIHTRRPATNTSTAHLLSNGLSLSSCMRVTIRNCHMQRPQYGGGGGNGYMYRLQYANECMVMDCVAEFSRHGLVVSHAGCSGNVFLRCEDRETARATGSNGSYNTSGSGSDNHMHFSHSNLYDQCHAHNSFYTAHHRRNFGTVPHGLTAAHTVYWNTSGSGTRGDSVVRTEQARYGYAIGTSGTRDQVSSTTNGNTAPADHVEGVGLGATLEPGSLYLDQLARRLENLPPPDTRTPFQRWADSEAIIFTGDENGDGIRNGMAWLLGAADPMADAPSPWLQPNLRNNLVEATFSVLQANARGYAVVTLQYSKDLVNWSDVVVPDSSAIKDGFAFLMTTQGPLNRITMRVLSSGPAAGSQMYFRLNGRL